VLAAALGASAAAGGCATSGGYPSGSEMKPDADEKKALDALAGKVAGKIVWSSSRANSHDLFVMNTDGTHVKQITKGPAVDWFPRFSPDGSLILFTRSKEGWEFERDSNVDGKWDLYTVTPEGKAPTKVVDNASWGSWISPEEIIYVRSTRVFRRKLASENEKLLVDSEEVPELGGAQLQQPKLSKDGLRLALTLRSRGETGIFDLKKKSWTRTGAGSQASWSPSGEEIYWVHPSGKGGSRVVHMPLGGDPVARKPKGAADDEAKDEDKAEAKEEGKAEAKDEDKSEDKAAAKSEDDSEDAGDDRKRSKKKVREVARQASPAAEQTLIDIPGARSSEHFPELSADGKWLVWAASEARQEYDLADYEIYLWQVGAPAESATRLTFHSGNDRWPDIFLGGLASAGAPGGEEGEGGAADETAARKGKEETAKDEGGEDKGGAGKGGEDKAGESEPAAVAAKDKKETADDDGSDDGDDADTVAATTGGASANKMSAKGEKKSKKKRSGKKRKRHR
jgi:hypothetical protein